MIPVPYLVHNGCLLVVIPHIAVLLPELGIQVRIADLRHSPGIHTLPGQRDRTVVILAASIGMDTHCIQTLPGIPFCFGIAYIIAYNINGLLINLNSSFGCLQPHKCRSHFTTLLCQPLSGLFLQFTALAERGTPVDAGGISHIPGVNSHLFQLRLG